ETSAERIRRMGEPASRVAVIGSPAADGLERIEPMDDDAARELGDPSGVFLMHPIGRHPEEEEHAAAVALEGLLDGLGGGGAHGGDAVLALDPNHDPGRAGIVRTLDAFEASGRIARRRHLTRGVFVSLLKRLAAGGGVLAGNSSAGLIEGAMLRVPAVNVGPRQGGRERAGNVVDSDGASPESVASAVREARGLALASLEHPYGDGRAGERAARALAALDPNDSALIRKRNAY
ncbi:MAG: UDP-N-acetylglucosamine 2-epimerase, partial [Planctomycetota bacterium]